MATPVEVPKFGNTVEECLVSRWLTRKGDSVSQGEVIAEIETDKTTFEIAAPIAGTVLEMFFEEGALVPVFTNLCVIGESGENVDGFRPGARDALPAVEPPSRADNSPSVPSAPSVPSGPSTESPASSHWSPRARKYAAAHGVGAPTTITGSGPNGRVLEQDVRRAYASSNTRKVIARRMRDSLASTAQYTLHASANAAGLLAARAAIKARAGGSAATIGDLVAFCTIAALGEMPQLNAEFVDGEIVSHAAVHLGFACDTPRGLIVPVVRDAHTLSLDALAARMKMLAAQATDGTIAPDDLTGGTFTISNLGALGIERFTPVLNAPQVAILGVGAIHVQPVRVDGQIEFIDAIGLSLTCDHQAIDGAPAARFLQRLTDRIEHVEEQCRNR